MARIRCHYADCVFIDEGFCSAAAVEIDPDSGCMTYSPSETSGKQWDAEDEELEEWEDDEAEDEEEELWDEEEDEF